MAYSLFQKTSVLVVGLFVLSIVFIPGSSAFADNIDPNNQGKETAQFKDLDMDNDGMNDIVNFEVASNSNQGMTVSDTGATGFVWGETVGWINTDPAGGGTSLSCSNDTATLTGDWWGENAGWINLGAGSALTINSSGQFNGDVWSENYGWLEFDCPGGETCVTTSYTPSCGGGPPPEPYAECEKFTVDKSTINNGETVELEWETNIDNYKSATIEPIGDVTGEEGEKDVVPSETTTYEAAFEGYDTTGTAECAIDVTVEEEEPVYGCTDESADNYDPDATINNGECDFCSDIPGTQGESYIDDDSVLTKQLLSVNGNTCKLPQPVEYVCSKDEAPQALNAINTPLAEIQVHRDSQCDYCSNMSGIQNLNQIDDLSKEQLVANGYQCSGVTEYVCSAGQSPKADNAVELPLAPRQKHRESECEYSEPPVSEDETEKGNEAQVGFLKKNYTVNETERTVTIALQRSGGISERVLVRVDVNDQSATRGDDYDSVPKYYLTWKAGDTSKKHISFRIYNDNKQEGDEIFDAEITAVEKAGITIQKTEITIEDDEEPPTPSASPAASGAAAAIALAAGVSTLPFRIQNLVLGLASYRRRHRPWGTVYDAQTKQPLDPAYVQLFDQEGNEIEAKITDLDGRFGFLVEPGTYYLKAGKTNYRFPSEELQGQKRDGGYTNLYFGQPITVHSKDEFVAYDIPMDPTGEDWNEKAKTRMKVAQFFSRHDTIAHRIIDVLFAIGLLVSVYAVVVSPIWYNFLILGFYVVFLIITIIGLTGRAYGRVIYPNGESTAGAIVRVYQANLDREIDHKVLGDNGRYYSLVAKGDYYLTVEIPRGDTYEKVYTSDIIHARNGIIRESITLP